MTSYLLLVSEKMIHKDKLLHTLCDAISIAMVSIDEGKELISYRMQSHL